MLPQRLQQLRKEYEVSKKQLARYMRVEINCIDAWESGELRPSKAQLQRMAELYQMSIEELCQEPGKKDAAKHDTPKKTNGKKNKTKKKTKRKTKHKTKNKTRTKKETIVKKRRIWPVVLLMLLLVAALGAGCAYLYWKYGDDYTITKKNTYKTTDIAGAYTAEDAHNAAPSQLILRSDGSYQFMVNLCSTMQEESGRWTLDKNKVTLHGTKDYAFTVKSVNQLQYDGDTLSCGPYHKDIFVRGSIPNTPQQDTPKEENETSPLGTYSGDHSTLIVSQVDKNQLVFTLRTLDPNDNSHVAALHDITATWDGHSASFTFSDDGYGNSGSGTILFDKQQATLQIQLVKNEKATWSIAESGTLYR